MEILYVSDEPSQNGTMTFAKLLFYLLNDFKLDELELLNDVLLLSEPKLWLSRRLGGNSKWNDESVDSENGGRARIPYVVGRFVGSFANIMLSRVNYKWTNSSD